jgi:hypothetical protein
MFIFTYISIKAPSGLFPSLPLSCNTYIYTFFDVVSSECFSSGWVGLELSALFWSSDASLVLESPPCWFGLLTWAPLCASDWRSGSGDWRPCWGADMLAVLGVRWIGGRVGREGEGRREKGGKGGETYSLWVVCGWLVRYIGRRVELFGCK